LRLLSLVFSSVMVVVTIKYICLVMRAANDGEGGIIALLGLASAAVVDPTRAVRVRLERLFVPQSRPFRRSNETAGLAVDLAGISRDETR
jgi:hypothetical protein